MPVQSGHHFPHASFTPPLAMMLLPARKMARRENDKQSRTRIIPAYQSRSSLRREIGRELSSAQLYASRTSPEKRRGPTGRQIHQWKGLLPLITVSLRQFADGGTTGPWGVLEPLRTRHELAEQCFVFLLHEPPLDSHACISEILAHVILHHLCPNLIICLTVRVGKGNTRETERSGT